MNSEEEENPEYETGLRSLGQLRTIIYQGFNTYRTYPVSQDQSSRKIWRYRLLRHTERTLRKAVLRRDWERATLLLLGCCRRTLRRSTNFTRHAVEFVDRVTVPTEFDLLTVMSFLIGGSEIRDTFIERRITDRDYLRTQARSIYFVFEISVNLMLMKDPNRALDIIQSALRYWKYGISHRRPITLILRMLIRYKAWLMHQLPVHEETETSILRTLWTTRLTEVNLKAKSEAVKILADFRRDTDPLIGGICSQYIRCEVLCWLGDSQLAEKGARTLSNVCSFHSDAHLLYLVMLIGVHGPVRRPKEILMALGRLLEMNPHLEGLPGLLEAVWAVVDVEDDYDDYDVELQSEYWTLMVSILDSCHPEHHSISYCIQQWTRLLDILELEDPVNEQSALAGQILSLMGSRLPSWKKYFFGAFALRNWMRQSAINEELSEFLCVMCRVSCHLYGIDNEFCQTIINQLEHKWRSKIKKTQSKIKSW